MLARLEQASVRLTRAVALLGLAGLLTIAAVTLVDVLARWLFSAPIAGVYDLSTLFIAVVLSACFPSALARRDHIRVVFLAALLPDVINRILEVVASLATLLFFSLLVWQLADYTGEVWQSGETTFILEFPIAPWWAACTVLFALCIPVQVIVVLIDLMRVVRPDFLGGSSAPADPLLPA